MCSKADIMVCGSDEESQVRTEADWIRKDAELGAMAGNNPFLALKEKLAAEKKSKKS